MHCSLPTVKRFPAYLTELKHLRDTGITDVSSSMLGRAVGVDGITARKDLAVLEIAGLTGVGYRVDDLIDGMERFLGWKNASDAFLCGATALARALLAERHFADYGLRIVAGFDSALKTSEDNSSGDVPFYPNSEIPHLTRRLNIRLAILAVPDEEAQSTAELLTRSGVVALWDFTHVNLQLNSDVIVQKVNLAGDLAVLSVRLQERLNRH